MSSQELNTRFTATNRASPVMQKVKNDLNGINRAIKQQSPLQRSWNAGLNSNRRAVQQFGFQMSDFAIQIAGGQSAMLAFTQQGGQMLQFFGPAGSIMAAFLAVFGSLAIAFTKSGQSLADLFPLMGVLQDQFRGLGNALGVVKEVMIDFGNLVLNNLDVILISASLVAGFFATKWVASFFLARGAVGSLVAMLNILKVTLIRLGIGAVIIAIGYLIERMMALGSVVGGMGNAFRLLFRVAVDVFKRIAEQPSVIADAVRMASAKMAAYFIAKLGTMLSKFMEFTWDVAEGLNNLFNTNLEGAKLGLALTAINQQVMALEDTAAGAGSRIAGVFAKPIHSLEELKQAIAAMNDDQVDMRDWFSNMGQDAADGASSAADAINSRLTPAMERLKAVQDKVSSAVEGAMMAMVDGSKTGAEAFKAMASDIIKELYRIFVVKQITGFITDALGGMFGGGTATPAASGTGLPSFEGGGYTGSGSRAGGLDGRGGQLAILHPNETVTDHTKGGSGGINVTVNNTFAPGVSRAEFDSQMPRMIEATKAAVADAARRGGSFGKAFG